jgi:flagellar basal body-associated protein FliL
MKKFLKILLIVFITIVVIIIAGITYVMIKNPLGLGTIIKTSIIHSDADINITDNSNFDHPLLNEEQEARIIKSGVDIEKIPTEITPEQQQCGIDKLGEKRILEIAQGAEPSPMEILKLFPCL